jgi:ligand-binding sensor domain-containing protein
MLQTRDGYIWLGTRAGISRFDGVRFVTFDDRDRSQLREDEVWTLAEGTDGSLWAGTHGGGLSRYKDGRFTLYSTNDGLVSNFVTSLARERGGALWIGTEEGLSRFENGGFRNYTKKDGLVADIRVLALGGDGTLWIGTRSGALQSFRHAAFETPAGVSGPFTGGVRTLHEDREGALWIGAFDGLYRLKDGAIRKFTAADGFPADRVWTVHEDAQGDMWIGTVAGLYRYSDGRFTTHPLSSDEVTLRHVLSLGSDREGSLWLGFDGEGLARLRPSTFVTYTMRDGLPDSTVWAVVDDREGNVWMATDAGLARLRGGEIAAYEALSHQILSSLLADSRGRLWIGSQRGLYRLDAPGKCRSRVCADHVESIPTGGTPRAYVRVLYEDRSGTVWAGTDSSGLVRYRDGETTTVTTKDGLSNNAIRGIAEDKAGNLWIGTKGGGLDRLRDGRVQVFTEKEGLAGDAVQSLHIDRDDTLWIATRQGVSRLKDGKLTTYTVREGLPSSYVYGFAEDDRGNLWMSCAKGVFRVAKQEFENMAQGKASSVVSVAYGLEHGLTSTTAMAGSYPVVSRSRDGRIWFGTTLGASVVDPTRIAINPLPPPVHIEEVTIDHAVVPTGAEFTAPPGRGDLVFRFTALSFLAPEKVALKYKLEPYEPTWVDADTRRVAQYTNIPPGRYTFKVIASNNDGVWNEKGAQFAFVLAPHFYQRNAFFALCALAIALAGAASQRLRVRFLQARETELALRVEQALAQVKTLQGLLPICASCKRIRDDSGYWNQMEAYLQRYTAAEFSHGICPDCVRKLYPGFADAINDREPT